MQGDDNRRTLVVELLTSLTRSPRLERVDEECRSLLLSCLAITLGQEGGAMAEYATSTAEHIVKRAQVNFAAAGFMTIQRNPFVFWVFGGYYFSIKFNTKRIRAQDVPGELLAEMLGMLAPRESAAMQVRSNCSNCVELFRIVPIFFEFQLTRGGSRRRPRRARRWPAWRGSSTSPRWSRTTSRCSSRG